MRITDVTTLKIIRNVTNDFLEYLHEFWKDPYCDNKLLLWVIHMFIFVRLQWSMFFSWGWPCLITFNVGDPYPLYGLYVLFILLFACLSVVYIFVIHLFYKGILDYIEHYKYKYCDNEPIDETRHYGGFCD